MHKNKTVKSQFAYPILKDVLGGPSQDLGDEVICYI